MGADVRVEGIYVPSQDVVAREIEGEIIIVPLLAAAAGRDDEQDALFTLNETGKAVWDRLDGARSLRAVIDELGAAYDAPAEPIEADVLGLVSALLDRRMLVARDGA